MSERETPLSASKAGKQWSRIGVRHHHGINIPLFSLHSNDSSGIGEFLDLCPLILWCKSLGLDVIQLLPLNDSGSDKSPYNALSAFALNPIFISLSKIPSIDKYPALQEKLGILKALNSEKFVPYDKVKKLKEEFLRFYFDKEYQTFEKTHEYNNFIHDHQSWLRAYSLFRVLKDKNEQKFWKLWPEHLKNLSEDAFNRLYDENKRECSFYEFLQFLCHTQLKYVKDFAVTNHLFLMGDLPILLSPDSADVWKNPNLFSINFSAGAPPDMYSSEGQTWGFPLYNWKEHENTHFFWWKERLRVANDYYELFRIDHVVGFFRIWAIPEGKSGKEGFFDPSDESLWIPQGKKIMKMMLESSDMLPIGEDLGVVPTNVRKCLKELGICGTKVMRWERAWKQDSHFIPIKEYIPESLTTVSTHDSETVPLWWKNNPEEAKTFAKTKGWTYNETISREQLFEILYDSHHSASLFHINLLQEYFSLFKELVHEKLEQERVNLPGVINETNWCYRFLPSLEEIISHKDLKKTIMDLIKQKS